MDRDRARDEEDDNPPPSKADLLLAQLKIVGRYVLYAAPVIAIAALAVAMVAIKNNSSQADRAKLQELTAKVDLLNASLSDAKGELDTLKFAMGREKAAQADERKKVDARNEMIVQGVTRLQLKLKVSPTLETQLQQAASAPAIAPSAANTAPAPVVAPATAEIGKNAVVAKTAPKAAGKKPAVAAPKHGASGSKATKAPAKPKSADKTPEQVKALKDAIEKFNQQ
jgi:hypothetical protein